jgi:hypothetical protein
MGMEEKIRGEDIRGEQVNAGQGSKQENMRMFDSLLLPDVYGAGVGEGKSHFLCI